MVWVERDFGGVDEGKDDVLPLERRERLRERTQHPLVTQQRQTLLL
jgi:hypothetical protein